MSISLSAVDYLQFLSIEIRAFITREATRNFRTITSLFTTQTGQSIRVSGPMKFNSFPQTIRESSSYNTFTLKYKQYLRSE